MQRVQAPGVPIPLAKAARHDRQEVHRFFPSGQNFNPLTTIPDYKERFDTLLSGFGRTDASELMNETWSRSRKRDAIQLRAPMTRVSAADLGRSVPASSEPLLTAAGGMNPLRRDRRLANGPRTDTMRHVPSYI